MAVIIKSDREIDEMRKAGRLAGECLDAMLALVKPGVTGQEIDRACRKWTAEKGAIPAPLNYHGFPASLCISPNDVVCHGIPDSAPFKNNSIVNLDVSPKINGWHGDTNATVILGNVDPKIKLLVETAHESMWAGIRKVAPGATLGDIGHAIQTLVESRGFSVVREFCGHGIGREFHEDPNVSHVGKPGQGVKLKAGMTFTIEPMINVGKMQVWVDEDDEWTVRTQDKSWSAQFEHTVLVTPSGFEVLTLRSSETVRS
jgi:methionyl aminopeptidase